MADVASTPETSRATTTAIAPRLGQWLEDYGEIATILPVLVGLFATSRLRLRGAQALMVNLVIAAIIRQAIHQLKQRAQPDATPPGSAPDPANWHDAQNGTTPTGEDYTIVHSVPGRIRLRIPRLASDALYAQRLHSLLSADARAKHVRINRAAASLAIQYDGTGVSELELGLYLLHVLEQAEAPVTPAPQAPPPESTS